MRCKNIQEIITSGKVAKLISIVNFWRKRQKQPFRGVLRKRCSANMLQIYRRTPVPKCDFNKVALQLYWNYTSVCLFSCKFAAYFQNSFLSEHLCRAASEKGHVDSCTSDSLSEDILWKSLLKTRRSRLFSLWSSKLKVH